MARVAGVGKGRRGCQGSQGLARVGKGRQGCGRERSTPTDRDRARAHATTFGDNISRGNKYFRCAFRKHMWRLAIMVSPCTSCQDINMIMPVAAMPNMSIWPPWPHALYVYCSLSLSLSLSPRRCARACFGRTQRGKERCWQGLARVGKGRQGLARVGKGWQGLAGVSKGQQGLARVSRGWQG